MTTGRSHQPNVLATIIVDMTDCQLEQELANRKLLKEDEQLRLTDVSTVNAVEGLNVMLQL